MKEVDGKTHRPDIITHESTAAVLCFLAEQTPGKCYVFVCPTFRMYTVDAQGVSVFQREPGQDIVGTARIGMCLICGLC